MRTKRIFAVVVALGLVAGNVWPHDIASDIDVETSAEVVAEQEPQPAVADSVTMAADTVKKVYRQSCACGSIGGAKPRNPYFRTIAPPLQQPGW